MVHIARGTKKVVYNDFSGFLLQGILSSLSVFIAMVLLVIRKEIRFAVIRSTPYPLYHLDIYTGS